MTQPRPPGINERYVAIPCSGEQSIGTELNHVYRILDYEHPSNRVTFRGWIPKERAIELFGETNVYFSSSHSLCAPCDRAGALDDLL